MSRRTTWPTLQQTRRPLAKRSEHVRCALIHLHLSRYVQVPELSNCRRRLERLLASLSGICTVMQPICSRECLCMCHCLQAPELTEEQKEYLAKAAADKEAACIAVWHVCTVIHPICSYECLLVCLCRCLQAPELTDEQKEHLAKAAADKEAACLAAWHMHCAPPDPRM
jgi:hypothetical protein